MGDQGQRPCHPGASSSYGKGEQLRSSQQCYARTEARTSRERLAARCSWNEGLLRIILVSGTRRMIICASNPVSSETRGGSPPLRLAREGALRRTQTGAEPIKRFPVIRAQTAVPLRRTIGSWASDRVLPERAPRHSLRKDHGL